MACCPIRYQYLWYDTITGGGPRVRAPRKRAPPVGRVGERERAKTGPLVIQCSVEGDVIKSSSPAARITKDLCQVDQHDCCTPARKVGRNARALAAHNHPKRVIHHQQEARWLVARFCTNTCGNAARLHDSDLISHNVSIKRLQEVNPSQNRELSALISNCKQYSVGELTF